MVRVRTRQVNGKECKKVLIAILFKALTSLAKHENLEYLHQLVRLFNSSLLVYSFVVKTIIIFNAIEIPRGEHRRFEPFGGYCLAVSRLDEILLHKRNIALKQTIVIFFLKNMLCIG